MIITKSGLGRVAIGCLVASINACGSKGSSPGSSASAPSPVLARPKAAPETQILDHVRIVDVRIPADHALVTEASYCVVGEVSDSCEKHAVLLVKKTDAIEAFDVKNDGVIRVTEEAAVHAIQSTIDALKAKYPNSLSGTDFTLNLKDIEDVLHLDYFYSIYRCRATKAIQGLIAKGNSFAGNFVLHSSLLFQADLNSGFLVNLEFDRKTHAFLGLLAFPDKSARQSSEYEFVGEPTSGDWTLITNVPRTSEVRVGHRPPRANNMNRSLISCDGLYESYRPERKAPTAYVDPAFTVLTTLRQDYTSVYEPELEAEPNFRDWADARMSFPPESTDYEVTALRMRSLSDVFFNRERFPKFNYAADPLWSVYKGE